MPPPRYGGQEPSMPMEQGMWLVSPLRSAAGAGAGFPSPLEASAGAEEGPQTGKGQAVRVCNSFVPLAVAVRRAGAHLCEVAGHD